MYSEDIDVKLCAFVLEQRDLQLPVSVDDICNLAIEWILPTNPNFKASRTWADKFMRHHDLVLRACRLREEESFHNFVLKHRRLDEFDDHLIVNMDETPMYFDLVPNRTVEIKGTKSIWIRTTASDKRHLTVVLACTAAGDMLLPMIIFKGKRELNLQHPPNWLVCVQEKGWMDEKLMIRWVKEVFLPFTEKDRSMLVLDSFREHLTETVKRTMRQGNCVPAVIPGGCTSKVQPLDVSINKPFKGEIRKSWPAFMRASVLSSVNQGERVRAASKQQVIDWIGGAFQTIQANRTLIIKSFLVCGISNSLSGAERDMVRNDVALNEHAPFDGDNSDDEFEGFGPEDLVESMDVMCD